MAIDHAHKPEVEKFLGELGVPVIRGDGRDESALEKARLDRALTFVACTGDDQVNIEAIMRVRHANPQIRIVSRMWDLDIVLVERDGEVSVQPSREITLEAGDGLVLFARQDRVREVVSRNVSEAVN